MREQDTACNLADETETSNRNIENKERVDRNAHAVPENSRATQDADSRGQGPCHEDEVDGYSGDCREANGAKESRDNQREERVSDDADGLEEGAGE